MLADEVATPPIWIDWEGYYAEFCAAHGGDPVPHDGRLLFRDGWTYCADRAGPELPPPANPAAKRALLIRYWQVRAADLRGQVVRQTLRLRELDQLQASRSLPIQEIEFFMGEDDELYQGTRTVDLEGEKGKLDELKAQLAKCNERLAELTGEAG